MRRLLGWDLELFVESGFMYLPLLLDPDIEKETRNRSGPEDLKEIGRSEPDSFVRHHGKLFVKALSIDSLIRNFGALDPPSYDRLKAECLREYQLTGELDDIFSDEILEMILLQIMPYFIKTRRGLQRRRLSEGEVLDLISTKVDIPPKYYRQALRFLDLEALTQIDRDLEERKAIYKPPADGLWHARKLRDWLHEAVRAQILAGARDRIKKALHARQQMVHLKPEHISIFLYIADKGSMEIEGFGFIRLKSHKEYLIYKRTGEYVLRDYYGRRYLFPDCRVAVSTYYTPLKPFVLDKYKHPFLRGHRAGQEICMNGFEPPDELSAEAVIRTLQGGITALLYGYDARQRNGYHSLDKTFVYIPTIVFEEYLI